MVLGTPNPSTTEHYIPPVAATVTVLPPDVYEIESGVYRMAFHQGIWGPNDDNGYYNIHINDELDEFVGGRAQIANTSMTQAHGFLNIPNGWKATKIYVDLRLDDGTKPPPGTPPIGSAIMHMYEVTTMTTADPLVVANDGPAALAGLTDGSEDAQAIANDEFTFTTGLVGNVANAMWIIVNFAAATSPQIDAEYIAGGYITLEKV